MTSEHDRRAEELFLAALELRPEARVASIHAGAGGDAALARDALALLAAHERTGDLDRLGADLGAPADGESDPVSPRADAEPADDALIGSLVGPYRLLRRLGRGGMGTVYLAERADGQFEHRVAIKLLRADRESQELHRRFLTERQILAQLVHSNIALLLDGSVTPDGRPYLVMEYVEGRPLIEYCDGRRLPVARRLELFLDVCAAVAYAHRRLVVHRDLKPGNTLVTDGGTVKLLDFGIAKLLDPAGLEVAATETGRRLMTPEYASPEQVRGEPVGTPSDVYQLGLLLFRLLTGGRPYPITRESPEAMEQAILSADPVRPSAALGSRDGPTETAETAARARGATVSRLTRQLTGDLDQIVLKALRKEPEARYGSVTEFADDIRRHLDGRPVLARRGTFRYRASRFVRRNRTGVAASALIALSLVGGVVGTVWQATRASEQARLARLERDRAQAEARKAEQIANLLTGMFDVAAEGGVRTDTLRLLPVLERTVARLRTELADQPEVQAATLVAVSDLYEKLGRYDDALEVAQASVRLYRSTVDSVHPDLAEALSNLGGVQMSRGRADSAQAAWAEALEIRRAVVERAAPNEPDSAALSQLAMGLHNLAVANWRQRRLELADSLESEAIVLREKTGGGSNLATSLDLLAIVKRDLGKPEEMAELAQRALAIRRSVLPNPHLELASSLNNVASSLLELKRYEEAEALYRESLEMRRALVGNEHPQVATAIHNMGAVLKELGRIDEAVRYYNDAIAMRRRVLGPDNLDLAVSLSALGLLYHERERYQEALPLFREALPMWRRGLRPDHGLVYKTQALIGDSEAKLGRFGPAERDLRAAYDGLMATVGSEHSETRRAKRFLWELYRDWGRPELAARYESGAG